MRGWKFVAPLVAAVLLAGLTQESEAGWLFRRGRSKVVVRTRSGCPGGVCPAARPQTTVRAHNATMVVPTTPSGAVIVAPAAGSPCPGGVCPLPGVRVRARNSTILFDSGDQALNLINAHRARHGRAPCVRADLGAAGHSQFMAAGGGLQHAQGWTENIGAGQSTPEQIVQDWINSPGHNQNLLNPGLTVMDVAQVGSYWTMRGR